MQTVLSGNIRPAPGDIVLATVHELGKHRRLELRSGRRARLLPGDEIIVAYGNRYASDQFEALVGEDLGGCDLVAAGGIAAKEVCHHERMVPPTWIVPVGLIGDARGRRINLTDYAIRLSGAARSIRTVVVAGTGMNAGKTYSAASIIRGMKTKGMRVAGIKVTGTGAGGDLWHYRDLGADVVYDFTDAGFASTYKVDTEDLEEAAMTLIGQASRANCSHAVTEFADGLEQAETADLLQSSRIRRMIDGVVFAAYDAMGAQRGVEKLRALGHRVLAVSGQICRSPLAMREAARAIDVPVYHPADLQQGVLFDPVLPVAPPIQFGEPMLTKPLAHIMRFGRERVMNLGYDQSYSVHRTRWSAFPQVDDDDPEIDEVEGA
ncbi:hypothetical protein [Pelagibius sp.]|uniref:hypothetical protein n=1 Tax=Pelagibius sp. TaxID=1931238 RepID=UPI00260F3422|nr:hypothetical protein [Pelagibius sp.]